MREFFKAHRFNAANRRLLDYVQDILNEYATQGFCLTLRQLYYVFIARDLFPDTWIDVQYNLKHDLPPDTKNTVKNYQRCGVLIGNARLAGEIDWGMFEDRGRVPRSNSHWDSPAAIVRASRDSFAVDKWRDQDWYVEVMIEKEALAGVIQPVCEELDITFTANKGYSSLSAMYEAGNRYREALANGKQVELIYLGDHDPSGLDMTRDIEERLSMFAKAEVQVRRVALNKDQIEQYQPPPNPAKTADSRYRLYVTLYGKESWELDALEPRVMQELVTKEVLALRDEDVWEEAIERETEAQERLGDLAEMLEAEEEEEKST